MNISKADVTEAFVWIWLPGATEPVMAGRLHRNAAHLRFTYGPSYICIKKSISLYEPELPLQENTIDPIDGLPMASCSRDGSPDAWGRRVILNELAGNCPAAAAGPEISELTFLLRSGSDRIGALDFQSSATEYVPRLAAHASIDELLRAAALVNKGVPLPPALRQTIDYATPIGGARPKVLIDDGKTKFIAKFAASSDTYSIVKAEFIAMTLARACGLDVAKVSLSRAVHDDVLLIERFDRLHTNEGWTRRSMVSALTMLGLDEMMARYASYGDLAEIVRGRFTSPEQTLKELYGRICFNVLCGNVDDHARNHSAFWDGRWLTLTPAYDICPQARTGNEATQAMLIKGDNRASALSTLLAAAPDYDLSETEAVVLIERQITTIADNWAEVCAQAELCPADGHLFARRQFLNEYAIERLDNQKPLKESFLTAKNVLIGGAPA
jgi:serine/threonine-protein kinase HipA